MIFIFFCICLIFSVAFHPPLMQSKAQPHLPAGNCHCAPPPPPLSLYVVCPSLSPSLFYSLLFGFSFCSLCFKLGTSFAFLSFLLFSFDFSFLCMLRGCNFRPSSLSSSTQSAMLLPPPSLLLVIIIFGCCGCNPSARSVPAIFIVLCTHNFILAHFWVVSFYGYI